MPDAVRFATRRQGSVYEYVTEVGDGSAASIEGLAPYARFHTGYPVGDRRTKSPKGACPLECKCGSHWRAKANWKRLYQEFERSCKFSKNRFRFQFAALALLARGLAILSCIRELRRRPWAVGLPARRVYRLSFFPFCRRRGLAHCTCYRYRFPLCAR